MNYNKDEYGKKIYVNFGEDISTATELTLILEPMIGDSKEKTTSDGVAVGTSNVDVDDQTYIANEYIEYTTADGDLDYAGQWRKKGKAQLSSTNLVVTDYEKFTVLS